MKPVCFRWYHLFAIDFNLPTPCGVGRKDTTIRPSGILFQSTHPVWGGTRPRSAGCSTPEISIHPPRVGWDQAVIRQPLQLLISIHPPRVGWDSRYVRRKRRTKHFNPPTPCGVGRPSGLSFQERVRFQSTHPVWGGTLSAPTLGADVPISIHPPRVGWDPRPWPKPRSPGHFNPPTPCGVGRGQEHGRPRRVGISIHPPRVGWDRNPYKRKPGIHISIHPPRVGWDGVT